MKNNVNNKGEAAEGKEVEKTDVKAETESERSKEVVKSEEETPGLKKKRGCFFHGCMTLLIINFVFVVAITCGGWIVGDMFSRQYLDMSLTEAFGVARGISHSGDSIIDNPYSESDETGFYDSVGEALLLKDGVIDGEELKTSVIEGIKKGNFDENISDFAADVLQAENFDQAKIESIGTPNQDTDLVITDKQLAAFLNGVISSAVDGFVTGELQNAGMDEYGVDLSNLDVKNYVKIEQIKFHKENKTVDGSDTQVGMALATVSVGFKDLFNDLKKSLDFDKMAASAGVSKSLIKFGVNSAIRVLKAVLPSKLLLTADMGISHSIEPTITINDMNGEKMEHFYALLKKANLDLKAEINDAFISEDGAVKKVIDSINSTVDTGNIIENGELKVDIYQLIVDLAGINDGKTDESEIVTSDDILKTLQLVLSDNSAYLEALKSEDYSYKSFKFEKDENGKILFEDGQPKMRGSAQYYAVSSEQLDALLDDYEDAIIEEFSECYGLDPKYSVQQIIDVFSGEASEDDIMEMFDSGKISDIIKNKSGARGVTLNDKMIAAIVSMLWDFMFENGESGDVNIGDNVGIEFIYIEEHGAHHILNVGLNVDVKALLGNVDEFVQKIINGLIKDKFIVKAGLDITLNVSDSFKREETTLELNGRNAAVLNKLLIAFGSVNEGPEPTLTAAEGNSAGLSGLVDEYLVQIRDLFENMSKRLPGLSLAPSALKLPDIYSLLGLAVNGDLTEGDDGYISPEELKNSLQLVIGEDLFAQGGKYEFFAEGTVDPNSDLSKYYESCEQNFFDEIKSKYCLADRIDGKTLTLNDVLYVLGITSQVGENVTADTDITDLFDKDRLEELIDDDRADWRDELKVHITNTPFDQSDNGDMLTAVLRKVVFDGSFDLEFGNAGMSFTPDNFMFAELKNENGHRFLTVYIKTVVSELFTQDGSEESEFIYGLLPTTPSLISLKVDVSDGGNYLDGKIVINGDEARTEDLKKILTKFGMDIDLDTISNSVRDAFSQIGDKISIEYPENGAGLTLPNMFALIDDLVLDGMYSEQGKEGDVIIKDALKGIYKTSTKQVGNKTKEEIFAETEIVGTTKSSKEYTNFLNDIKAKYFLEGDVADATTFDEFYAKVKIDDFNADSLNIDGVNGLAYTEKPLYSAGTDHSQDLTPFMKLSELGAVVDEYLKKSGENNMHVHSLSYDEAGKKLTIYVTVILKELFPSDDDSDMQELLSVEKLYARITVDMSKVSDSDGKKYYECDVTVNNMSETDLKNLFDIIGMLGSTATDLDSLEEKVGGAVYDGLSKLDEAYNGNYTLKSEGVELADIFTFLKMNILDEDKSFEAEDIRKAIQGLYAYSSEYSGGNKYNYKVNGDEAIVRNAVATKSIEPSQMGNGIFDNEMGAYLAKTQQIKDIGSLVQLNILAASDHGANGEKERTYLSSKNFDIKSDKNYITMTLYAQRDKLFGAIDSTSAASSAKIIPNDMYITFVFDFDGNSFKLADYTVNSMDLKARDALIALTKLDTAMDTLKENSDACLGPVNNLLVTIAGIENAKGNHGAHIFEAADQGTACGKYSYGSK